MKYFTVTSLLLALVAVASATATPEQHLAARDPAKKVKAPSGGDDSDEPASASSAASSSSYAVPTNMAHVAAGGFGAAAVAVAVGML